MTDTTSLSARDLSDPREGEAGQVRVRRAKGERRQQQVAHAAAEIVLEQGPAAVTHRAVAAKARASLSATTYYFKDLADLFDAAGEILVASWQDRVKALRIESGRVTPGDIEAAANVIVRIAIPNDHVSGIRGFYETLVQVGRTNRLVSATKQMRPGAEEVVSEMLTTLLPDIKVDVHNVMAIIDGAAVQALCEGQGPIQHATEMLSQYLRDVG